MILLERWMALGWKRRRVAPFRAGVLMVLGWFACGWSLTPAAAQPDRYAGPLDLMLRQIEVEVPLNSGDSGPGVVRPRVLAAMGRVPRHEFVAPDQRDLCYESRSLSIAPGRNLPPPYLAAILADLLSLEPGETVLEIGTGTGYQAALMSLLAGSVLTVEPDERLAGEAANRLARLGFDRVEVGRAPGLGGWPSRGPFDAILVRGAVSEVPLALVEQLAVGGVLVVPVERDGGQPILTRVALKKPKRRKREPKLYLQPLMPVEMESFPLP